MAVDLSDLDPYHSASSTPGRVDSPNLFQSTSLAPDRTSGSTTPLPPPPLPSQTVKPDDGPLGSLMSFSDQLPIVGSAPLAQQVAAQTQRREEVLEHLYRSPFDLLSEEPSSIPASTTGTPIPISKRPTGTSRRSSSGGATRPGSSSFSPPRRLSGLMFDTHSTASTSSSPPPHSHAFGPIVSHTSASDFHPNAPRPHAAQATMRRASFSSSTAPPPTSPSLADMWSDFQSADPLPSPAAAPPVHSNSVPQPGDPLKAAYARQLAGGRAGSLPVKGKGKALDHAEEAEGPKRPWNQAWTYDANSEGAVHPIKLLGVREGVRRALDEDIAEGIRPSLPPRVKLSTKWTLLYSLDQHGISISTMYDRMKVGLRGVDSGVVIVVKDANDSVFGAYVNEPLKDQKSYYGDGTCLLWKSTPFAKDDFRVGSSVRTFPWTGRNSYFVLSESSYLSVGGGDGKFGLWVDGVFEKGFSSRSPCFANEPLPAKENWHRGVGGVDEAKFEVVQLECWAVSL